MLEPSINTIAFYFHERAWRSSMLKKLNTSNIKTISFAVVHFSVAFSVVYALTGDAFAGGSVAVIEPSINTIAYTIHERYWNKKQIAY